MAYPAAGGRSPRASAPPAPALSVYSPCLCPQAPESRPRGRRRAPLRRDDRREARGLLGVRVPPERWRRPQPQRGRPRPAPGAGATAVNLKRAALHRGALLHPVPARTTKD